MLHAMEGPVFSFVSYNTLRLTGEIPEWTNFRASAFLPLIGWENPNNSAKPLQCMEVVQFISGNGKNFVLKNST